jgi:hypothetical protein
VRGIQVFHVKGRFVTLYLQQPYSRNLLKAFRTSSSGMARSATSTNGNRVAATRLVRFLKKRTEATPEEDLVYRRNGLQSHCTHGRCS